MRKILLSDNYRMAINSVRAARMRSLLTMLGIIVGVVSVITTVSLGEGAKNQVVGQIGHLGSNLITVLPGKLVERDPSGNINKVNILSGLATGSLSEQDLRSVELTGNIEAVAPINLVRGSIKAEGRSFDRAVIIGTTESLPDILNQKLEYGSFFERGPSDMNSVVIGQGVARSMFRENVPIGKTVQIRGKDFLVRGVFEKFEPNPIDPATNFNNAIFMSLESSKSIANGGTAISQILAKVSDPSKTLGTVHSINSSIKANHGGEDDFTVLRQDDTLAIASNIVSLITKLVAGIAGITIIIGGVGIMNIMLVTVSERTREVGIRKAVGASNSQIREQFIIEAIVLCVWGAALGVVISGLINLILRITTDLKPVITWQVVAVSAGVAIIVGVIFGIAPAIKASRKDPIEALRTL